MDCLMSFSDFLLAFQMQLYYEGQLHEVYRRCMSAHDEIAKLRNKKVKIWPTLIYIMESKLRVVPIGQVKL